MGLIKYRILTTYILFFCLSCNTKQEAISYILLEKHSGKSQSGYEDKYTYSETYLVDNLIEREKKRGVDDAVYNILFNYFKNNNKICLLEDDITTYSMNFYRRSSCTEYFIENKEDHAGISQKIFNDCKGDIEYSLYYKRDKDNPNMWTNSIITKYWSEKYRDTIYCKPNREKIKLPDVPRE